jgi:hypothetical protein
VAFDVAATTTHLILDPAEQHVEGVCCGLLRIFVVGIRSGRTARLDFAIAHCHPRVDVVAIAMPVPALTRPHHHVARLDVIRIPLQPLGTRLDFGAQRFGSIHALECDANGNLHDLWDLGWTVCRF